MRHRLSSAIDILGLLLSILWLWLWRDHPIMDKGTILWTCIAARGLLSTWRTFLDTRREWNAARSRKDRVLLNLAGANYRREAIRLSKFVLLLFIGVALAFGINNPAVSRFVIALVVLGMWLNSELDQVERRQTQRILMQALPSEPKQ